MNIFELSEQWPPEEKYALTDQIRRSSRSVCANIGEAWFKKQYPKYFVSKLSDASSEAAEPSYRSTLLANVATSRPTPLVPLSKSFAEPSVALRR